MWDAEGKEVDTHVIKKLITRYPSYFESNRLGRDRFITLRVPNPSVEKAEAKILLETLEGIPRSHDAAKAVYGDDIPPIFEVILPMTQTAHSMDRVYRYYRDYVAGKQYLQIAPGDITISDWIGEFKPESIDVIPLFEDFESMLHADAVVEQYKERKDLEDIRVFLARSDPAMNYGPVAAVLVNKISLYKLHLLQERTGDRIYPIIGVGSAPFRGNLRPSTVDRVLKEYPSVQTFTIQSAFKYDNPPDKVRSAVGKIEEHSPSTPMEVDENQYIEIIEAYTKEYQKQILELAPAINSVSKAVPSRRKRKLHIGLFGYSRSLNGTSLPRVITFTAALYSVGLPPELLGFNAFSEGDLQRLREVYVNLDADLADALRYYDPESPYVPEELRNWLVPYVKDVAIDEKHVAYSRQVAKYLKGGEASELENSVLSAAHCRGFLG